MSWDFDSYRFDDRETTEAEHLQHRRQHLLESIAQAANDIKEIDRLLAIIKSQELERDLNQAAEKAKT